MEFLYKKKIGFRRMISVFAALLVAVCATTAIVIAQETSSSQPQVICVQNDSTDSAAAVDTKPADSGSGQENSGKISNEYIAAATSIAPVAAVAAQAAAATKTADVNTQPIAVPAKSAEQNQPAAATEDSNAVFVDGTLQSITFKRDMAVRDALRTLAAKFHKNIIPSMKVDGTIAVTTLYDVTFEDALNAILGNNFKWEQDGSFVKIYTADEYKKIKTDEGRMLYKVFTLYYVNSAEAEKLIKPILSDKGKVQSSSAAEKQLSSGGGSGSSGGGGGGGGDSTSGDLTGGGGGDNMAMHDSVVVYDYPEYIVRAEDLLKSFDVRPKQVLVEATILSATLTEGMELGVDLNFMNGVHLNTIADVPTVPGSPIETSGFAGTLSGSGLKVGVTSGDATGFITALETVTDTTIMANPKILAVNKQEGQLHIGDRLGYATITSQSQTSTTSQIQFLDTGTMLTFRPYIGNDGYIRMDIYPKDSSGDVDKNGIPNERTTQLKTNILVKDGETIVIGGLFRDEIDTKRNQIPILGDLPFIGVLFRGTSDTSIRKEVIILLTPHIIDAPNQTDGLARAADIERRRHGSIQSLQWLQRSRLADDWYAEAVELYSKGDKTSALCKLKCVLELRPTYLEAMRLQEKIVAEIGTCDASTTRRIMMERLEAEEMPIWNRL